ncbi:MAG: hypothetical protein JNK82_18080 [Myxococcaceae bacterium]|nr:hypothetical protein [Myxococcaceae bacterium]
MKRLVLLAALSACPSEEKVAKPIAASPVPKPAAVEAPDAAVAPEPEPAPAPADPEVKFTGTIDAGKLKPARIVFLVTRDACTEKSDALDVMEQMDVSAGELFTEMTFPEGTVGHLCAVALDAKGQQVGFAAHEKNPVTFQGGGQVEVKDVSLKLKSVKARPAPKGM